MNTTNTNAADSVNIDDIKAAIEKIKALPPVRRIDIKYARLIDRAYFIPAEYNVIEPNVDTWFLPYPEDIGIRQEQDLWEQDR